MEIENKTRWHPAFCAVMELERHLHIWLKSLTRNMDRSQAEELLDFCDNLHNRDDEAYEKAKKVVNLVSDINEEIFEKITVGGEKMSDKLKYMVLPELKEVKEQLADREAELADSRAEIEKLKRELAEARATNVRKRTSEHVLFPFMCKGVKER